MRTEESKERLLEMVQMRIDGYTIQQIADKYGVSKQCIQQHLSILAGARGEYSKRIDERIIYPNLAKWINDNNIPKYKLSEMIGLANNCTTSINRKLCGKTEFTIKEIKKILEVSGQTFEYMFSESENK